jgi:hypothetical protein
LNDDPYTQGQIDLINRMQEDQRKFAELSKLPPATHEFDLDGSARASLTEAFKQWGIPTLQDSIAGGVALQTRKEMMRPDYGDGINRSDPAIRREEQGWVGEPESSTLPVDESSYHWNYLYSIVMSSDHKIVSGLPAVVKDTQDFLKKLDFTVEVDNMPAIYNIVIAQTEPMSQYELQLVGHFLTKQCQEHHIDFQQINFMGAERVNDTTGEHTVLDIQV